MSDDVARTTFPKLNDSNYGTWAVMMEAYLTSKDLFTDLVVIEVDKEDSTGAARPQPDIDAEIEKKRKARSAKKKAQARAEMILRVEPGQLAHMRSKDPLDVWQDLQAVHRARGFAAALALRKKFLMMKMGKNQSMTSWIGEVKEQVFNMTETGIEITDHDTILALTGGLPATYGTSIATLDATPPASLTLDFVVSHLLSAETQVGSCPATRAATVASDQDHNIQNVALAAQSAPRCYVCDEVGHIKRDCPYRVAIDDMKKKSASDSANVAVAVDVLEEADYDW